MVERKDVVANGVRLATYTSADANLPAMILLHALGQDAAHWDEVRPAFEPYFQVIAIDLRGHGNSDWPGEYSFELMRDDVLEVLDQLGLVRFALVGHSMGGGVAYLIAEQHPSRVERLVIEDAAPPYPRDHPIPVEPPDEQFPFDWPVVPAIIGQVNDPDPIFWELLGEITAPTLLVAGGPDSHISQEKIAEAAELIAHAKVVTIPVGHRVHELRPDEFVDAVLAFCAERLP